MGRSAEMNLGIVASPESALANRPPKPGKIELSDWWRARIAEVSDPQRKSPTRTVVWLKLKALFLREGFACHQLGAMYATGDGVTKSDRDAVLWYRRGAERGDPECQYDLGFMYLLGEVVDGYLQMAGPWVTRPR